MLNQYDIALEQILEGMIYPEGRTWKNEEGKTQYHNPVYQSPEDMRFAESRASMQEDAFLRSQLGSKRSLGKNERRTPGSYSMAEFPGARHQVWAASSGMAPKGVYWGDLAGESREERMRRMKMQEAWANEQARLWGI